MTFELTMTAYQLGTHVFHALREKATGNHFPLLLLSKFDIVEDPAEAWLIDYPEKNRISKDEAGRALEEARSYREAANLDKLVKIQEKMIFDVELLKSRFEASVESRNREFLRDICQALEREPTTTDLDAVFALYVERKKIRDAEALGQRLDGESEEAARIRRAVEIGQAALNRLEASQRGAADLLGIKETAAGKALREMATRPQSTEQRLAEERERESYRRYADLIRKHDRKR